MSSPNQKKHPSTYLDKLHNILKYHPNDLKIFRDGSKNNNKTVYTAILNKTIMRKSLPKQSSIFTAEACDLALNIISESNHQNLIIFSDLLSILLSLRNEKLEDPLIIKLLSRLDSMSYMLNFKPYWREGKWKSWLGKQITSMINTSWSNLWENRDQPSENLEKNKLQYPNYTFVTQHLCTLLNSNTNKNHSV